MEFLACAAGEVSRTAGRIVMRPAVWPCVLRLRPGAGAKRPTPASLRTGDRCHRCGNPFSRRYGPTIRACATANTRNKRSSARAAGGVSPYGVKPPFVRCRGRRPRRPGGISFVFHLRRGEDEKQTFHPRGRPSPARLSPCCRHILPFAALSAADREALPVTFLQRLFSARKGFSAGVTKNIKKFLQKDEKLLDFRALYCYINEAPVRGHGCIMR